MMKRRFLFRQYKLFIFLSLCFGNSYAFGLYVSGNGFRSLCKFAIDTGDGFAGRVVHFNPELVQKGDSIFVQQSLLDVFFKRYHPKIKNQYVLVSHHAVGTPRNLFVYLDDEKILHWFDSQKYILSHPKYTPIPIGLPNSHSAFNPEGVINRASKTGKKDILLYINFVIKNFPRDRQPAYDYFSKQSWCFISSRKPFEQYIADLGRSKFVLSPHGDAPDCYRTWEALLMRAIPVVRSSRLDKLYENLPILIVRDWREITESFLNQKYKELSLIIRDHGLEKLYLVYWRKLINSYKNKT